ncbi:hypothetical protein OIU76_024460 [Salix suchowensis]|nr:hypothetical protein OIU76_024460 [Salix suchowensis]
MLIIKWLLEPRTCNGLCRTERNRRFPFSSLVLLLSLEGNHHPSS